MASQKPSIAQANLQGITLQTFGENFYSTSRNVSIIINAWRAKLDDRANPFDDIYIVDVDVDFEKEIPGNEELDPARNYFIANRGNGKLREDFVQSLYFEYCGVISSQNASNVHDYYIDPHNEFFASLYPKYIELFGPIALGLTRYSQNDFKRSVFRLEDCITKSFGKVLTTEFILYTIEQFRKHFIISEQLDIPGNNVDVVADAEEPIVLVDDHVYTQQLTQLLDSMDNIQFSRKQKLNQYVRSFHEDYRGSFFIMSDYALDWEDEIQNDILDEFVEIFSPTVLEDSELHRLLQMLKSDDESYYFTGIKIDGSIRYDHFIKDAIYNVETHLLNLHSFASDKSNADEFYEAMMILYTLIIKLEEDADKDEEDEDD